jgi:hypothetical protein
VDWICADLLDWVPEPASSDLVLLAYLHMPPDEMRLVVERACRAVAPGGTFLLIAHDRTNLERGHGGPQEPSILYEADDIVGLLSGLHIVEAGTRLRPVETDRGTVNAIDCLVRAHRAP